MSIWRSIYGAYRRQVFPSVKRVRGATRLQNFLRDRALGGLNQIQSDQRVNVLDRDWQNLVVLDACRYDLFEQFVDGYSADFIYSMGSSSSEFIEKTFSDAKLEDTVLLTANPHFHKSQFRELTGKDPDDVFYSVYHLYESHWSEKEGTVLPQDVSKAATSASKLFPDKRLIIWYMQPHFPFITSQIEGAPLGTAASDEKESVWARAAKGKYGVDEVWQAYGENLENVMREVKDLEESLEGRTIVTSDHGNLVGEANIFGHPEYANVEELHKVPWVELK